MKTFFAQEYITGNQFICEGVQPSIEIAAFYKNCYTVLLTITVFPNAERTKASAILVKLHAYNFYCVSEPRIEKTQKDFEMLLIWRYAFDSVFRYKVADAVQAQSE